MKKIKKEKMKKVTPETYDGPTSSKNKKYYPSVNFKLQDIPEAKSWEVGNTYMMIIGAKMTSIREDEDGSDVSFKILKVKPINKEK